MKLRLSVTLLLLFTGFFSIAQIRPYDKREFRKNFEQGNLLVLEQFYDTALHTFLYIQEMDTANANVNYKVGFLYLQSKSQKQKAITYLKSASKMISKKYVEFESSERNAPEIALYYLAIAYHLDFKFDEAIATFEQYKALVNKKNTEAILDINHRIDWCKNAKEFVNAPVPYLINNLGDSVNSPYPDYSPVISADEDILMFTSTRKGTGGEANQTPEGNYFEDIWVCNRKKDGTWSSAKSIGNKINTLDNEATIGLSADGQQLYIYKDDNGDGNIYLSELNGDEWEIPEKMGSGEGEVTDINTKAWETHACVSADGNTLYFVSDRKGGYGGRDIYKCVKLPNGKWSKARNLGPKVNTPYDEDAPFIHPDNITLFFSSKGHNSMGGFDIMFTTKQDTTWSEPTNLGYPLNTPDDDVFYVMSTDGKRAYFSSNREDGKGEKDIYMVNLPKAIVEPVALMVYYIKNSDGTPLSANTSVHLVSAETGEDVNFSPNRATGKVVMALPPCKKYSFAVEVDEKVAYNDEKFKSDCIDFIETQKENTPHYIWLGGPPPNDSLDPKKTLCISGFIGDKKNLPKRSIIEKLNDSKETPVRLTATDSTGVFKFNNLPNDRSYTIDVVENDENIYYKGIPITIKKMNGDTVPQTRIVNNANRIKFILNDNTNTVTINIHKKGEYVPQLMYIEGTIMSKANPTAPIDHPVDVKLTDDDGESIQTVTAINGHFKFINLDQKTNYLVLVNEFNTEAAHFATITAFNTVTNRDMKVSKTSSAPDDVFLVADTKMKITVRLKRKDKDNDHVTLEHITTSEDKLKQFGDAAFEYHFTYAKTELDPAADDFQKLLDGIISRYNSTGYCKVYLNCCASKVPVNPAKFKDNLEIAKMRDMESESMIVRGLKQKGFDAKKIVFTSNYKVKGPEYRGDYVENRKEYENWQYVKVFLLDKK